MINRNSNHLVSIVIPAYNEAKYLHRCLECVNSQVCTLPFEVIVVNNNSTDDTVAIAIEMGARVVFEPRKGIARARQTGFDNARGTIIASVDADTLVPAHWLQVLSNTLLEYPHTVAATCPAYYWDSSFMYILARIWYGIGYPISKISGQLTGRGHFPLSAPCYVVWADALREVGGLDTRLQIGEDADLSLRLSRYGRIELLKCLHVYTSARRFKSNFFGNAFLWGVNYLSMSVSGRIVVNKYPDYR